MLTLVAFKQLADFCIRIIPNDTEPGGVLSWTVPFLSTDSRNAFESLSFAEADVITLGIYGLRWVELQRRRKAWSRELRERKGKEYSACIEALRVLRDWTYAGMDRTSGERTISGEMLADDFPWDLAPAFRAATGEDLRSMPKIVELLRHLGSQYQASPAATVDEYRLESAYRITKKEQLWANEAARKWIKPKLDSLGWIREYNGCISWNETLINRSATPTLQPVPNCRRQVLRATSFHQKVQHPYREVVLYD